MALKTLKNPKGDDIYIDSAAVVLIEQDYITDDPVRPRTQLSLSNGAIRIVLGRPWEVKDLMES